MIFLLNYKLALLQFASVEGKRNAQRDRRGKPVLTLINLRMLNDDLEEQAEDAWVLSVLITALQGQVETASNIGRLAVTQLKHLWVTDGARKVILHSLLLPLAVGEAVVVEKHACSQVGRNHELPRHELIFWKAQGIVWGHQCDGRLLVQNGFNNT